MMINVFLSNISTVETIQTTNFEINFVFSVKLKFTSMVCDWCMDLMADWAICLAVNVTNAQPERQKHSVS